MHNVMAFAFSAQGRYDGISSAKDPSAVMLIFRENGEFRMHPTYNSSSGLHCLDSLKGRMSEQPRLDDRGQGGILAG